MNNINLKWVKSKLFPTTHKCGDVFSIADLPDSPNAWGLSLSGELRVYWNTSRGRRCVCIVPYKDLKDMREKLPVAKQAVKNILIDVLEYYVACTTTDPDGTEYDG